MPHISAGADMSPSQPQPQPPSPTSMSNVLTHEEYKEQDDTYQACFDEYSSDTEIESEITDDSIMIASPDLDASSTCIPSFTSHPDALPSIALLATSLTEAGRQHYQHASLFGTRKHTQEQEQEQEQKANQHTHITSNTSDNTTTNTQPRINRKSASSPTSIIISPSPSASTSKSYPPLPRAQHTFLGIHILQADIPTDCIPSSAKTCDNLRLWCAHTEASHDTKLYLRACLTSHTQHQLHTWIQPNHIQQTLVIGSFRLRVLDIQTITPTTPTPTQKLDIRVTVAIDKLASGATPSPSSQLMPSLIPGKSQQVILSTSLVAPCHITWARSITAYHDTLEIQLLHRAVPSSTPTPSSQSQSQSLSQSQSTSISTSTDILPSSFTWSLELSMMRLCESIEAHAILTLSQLHTALTSPITCHVADHDITIYAIQTSSHVTWTHDKITSTQPFLDVTLGVTITRNASTHITEEEDDSNDVAHLSAELDALFDFHSDSDPED